MELYDIALKQQFEDKLQQQAGKYEAELSLLKDEIIKLKGGNIGKVKNKNENEMKESMY